MNRTTREAIAPTRNQRVGWIGAGKMGAPMIRNLLAAGTAVAVTEAAPARREEILGSGATPARLADHAETSLVFATLPHDAALRAVVLGDEESPGLAALLAPGAVFVEMSTVSPECSVAIAEALRNAGIHYLRAPLSGSTALAESGALTVLASGDRTAWDAALPHLEAMSARQFLLGEAEEARYMKLVLNTLVGASSAVLSEALALGACGGLDRARMMEVINESAVASPLLKYKTEAVAKGDYAPAFSVEQMIKDFTLISDAGRAGGVPLFTTGLILELYRAAANAGLKDADFFALVKWQSDNAKR